MSFLLALPAYMRGRNCSFAGITPQSATISTPGTGGNGVALAASGSGYNLKTLGILDTVEFTGTCNGFELHPTDGAYENYVPTFDGFELKVGELDRNNAPSVLRAVWGSFNYFRFEFDVQDDAGVPNAIFAVLVTRAGGTINYGLVEDKNGTIATFKPCGIPPYYGNGTPPF